MVTQFVLFLKDHFSLNAEVKVTSETSVTVQFSLPKDNNKNQSDNLIFVYFYDSKDPNYFRIALPVVDRLDESNRISHVQDTLSNLNFKFKVGKGCLVGKDVWLFCEAFVYSKENIEKLFERAIIVLNQYYHEYNKLAKNITPNE